jgi:hypothetical protein
MESNISTQNVSRVWLVLLVCLEITPEQYALSLCCFKYTSALKSLQISVLCMTLEYHSVRWHCWACHQAGLYQLSFSERLLKCDLCVLYA